MDDGGNIVGAFIVGFIVALVLFVIIPDNVVGSNSVLVVDKIQSYKNIWSKKHCIKVTTRTEYESSKIFIYLDKCDYKIGDTLYIKK